MHRPHPAARANTFEPDNTAVPLVSDKPQAKPTTVGLTRIWRALFFSIDGLRAAWTFEAAFRQEILLAAVLLPTAFILPATLTQKALLIASVFLVLIAELANSAIEAIVDRISLERHELAKRAKDIGSATVLIALINFALVWAMVLVEVLA